MEDNNESRICNCENNTNNTIEFNYMPTGINAAYGYNSSSIANNSNCSCMNNTNEIRAKMMQKIKSLNFAVIELSQYLDTHPNDRKAICLYKEYANELDEVKNKYQKIFGPLSIYFPCNKWRWLETPWPWERSDF